MNKEELFFEKIETFGGFHMPRWADLPEIELYMDQVISVTDKYLGVFSVSGDPVLTPSMINNYVKNRVIPAPEKKKYNREHLAKLLVICILKPTMEISAISHIIEHSEKLYGTQKMLDTFSEMFEKRISSLSLEIGSALENCENKEELLCAIATENAIKAGTEKIIANYAYAAIRKEEPEAKSEKNEKKKEKDAKEPKEKKEEKAEEPAEK